MKDVRKGKNRKKRDEKRKDEIEVGQKWEKLHECMGNQKDKIKSKHAYGKKQQCGGGSKGGANHSIKQQCG